MALIYWVSGNGACQRATEKAKEKKGVVIEAESYKGIRPAFFVFEKVEDLLKTPHRFDDIVEDFTGYPGWVEYKKNLTLVDKKHWCRVYNKHGQIVIEKSTNWLEAYDLPDFAEYLDIEIQKELITKFHNKSRY